jgi:hypothetical protein
MVTLTPTARKIASALVAGLSLMRSPFTRDSRVRRQEELMLELLRQLARVAEELQRANLIQHHRLVVEQLDREIDDAALADASSTLTGLSEQRHRQMIFANRAYGTVLVGHQIGRLTWEELIGHLRVLCRNPVFAEYWERTVEHRRSLPADSLEGRVGGVVDTILEELADDPDEWWVVGQVDSDSANG